jgi:Class II Aldolase and Adducin N-terminal domain
MPLFEFEGRGPQVSPAAWIAPTAILVGDVRVEAEASVWYGAVLRADFGPILVRRGANVQDGSVLHGGTDPVTEVGEGATIGHLCVIHGAVIGYEAHTHSPYATAYAVAQRPIGCWIEAMAMFGLADGVPVAGYGPRGSAEAVASIRSAVIPGVPAVLLANHGVLVFHRTPDLAILAGSVVEEAAQAGLNSQGLGGPVEIPPDLRAAALQRAMAFDSRGIVHA